MVPQRYLWCHRYTFGTTETSMVPQILIVYPSKLIAENVWSISAIRINIISQLFTLLEKPNVPIGGMATGEGGGVTRIILYQIAIIQ